MKKHRFICATIIAVSMIACKKDNNSTELPAPAEGFWKGTYSKTGSPINEAMALLIQPNGHLRYYEMNLETDTSNVPALGKVSGTWMQDGAVLKISYFANAKTYNATLEMNAAETQLTGPWSENLTPKGSMGLIKQ